jgi:hypothetical protein
MEPVNFNSESAQNLYMSCRDGDLKRVKELIDQNVSVYGDNLLTAIQNEHESVANLLLDVYERDLEGSEIMN